jgi:RNA-binding protein NOB1
MVGAQGGWEKTRSRRVNRKHKRREIMVAEAEEEATRGGGCASAAAGGAEADGGDAGQPGPSASAETTDTTMGGAEGERTDGGEEGEDGESGNNNKFDMAAHSVESHVSIITSDFAMQNVILQMGLRLLTPDGVRIDSLQVSAEIPRSTSFRREISNRSRVQRWD